MENKQIAISVRQPWASMICSGKKTIETRRWLTTYRGDLLICSSGKPYYKNESGVMICLVELYDCKPMIKEDEKSACCQRYPGAFSWFLRNIRPVVRLPVTGKLRFYYLDKSTVVIIEEEVNRIKKAFNCNYCKYKDNPKLCAVNNKTTDCLEHKGSVLIKQLQQPESNCLITIDSSSDKPIILIRGTDGQVIKATSEAAFENRHQDKHSYLWRLH
jgi:hypothetical protein